MKDSREYKTPGVQSMGITQRQDGEFSLNENLQKIYRSGVGTLLYLVKHSRPDISNIVRELSKVMMVAGEHHYKMLLRAIKYVITTRNLAIEFEPII